MTSPAEITLRPGVPDDAEAIAALSGSLGYATPPEVMRARLEALDGASDRLVVAEIEGRVQGWVHGARERAIQSGDRIVIRGLVVAEASRRRGVGRALVGAIEEWAATQAVPVRVRCRDERVDAHRFYETQSYAHVKTQRIFDKEK